MIAPGLCLGACSSSAPASAAPSSSCAANRSRLPSSGRAEGAEGHAPRARLREAEEEKKKLAERLAALEERERKKEHEEKEDEEAGGGAAAEEKARRRLDGKHYEDAIAAYGEATKLIPDDAAAIKGLILAQTSATTANENDDKRKKVDDDYNKLMADGMKAKRTSGMPTRSCRSSRRLLVKPNDGDASKALIEVRDFLGFQFFMDQGEAAMVKQDYAAAPDFFTQAAGPIAGQRRRREA